VTILSPVRNKPSHLAVVEEPKIQTKVPSYSPKTIACWSGSGSPGRTTLAINLATELALSRKRILLIDLDTLSPAVGIALGLVDTPAGLSAVLRLAEQNRLTRSELSRLSVAIDVGRNELVFLPGISAASRWPEVSAERFELLLAQISGQFDLIVLDLPQATYPTTRLVHPALSQVEERDDLIRSVLTRSSKLITISGCDAISAKRFLEAQSLLLELGRADDQLVVVNRFRTSALGPDAKYELEQSFQNLANLRIDTFIPDEPENFDRALRNGLPLALLKRSSAARQAIKQLADQILLSSAKGEWRG